MIIMKVKYLLLIPAIICVGKLQAQNNTPLTVDCGEDIVICPGDIYSCIYGDATDTLFIGKNLKVTGGVSPYTYSWSCKTQGYDRWTFTVNDILNNTTIANPYFTRLPEDHKCTFTLKVTDAEGNIAVDSLKLFQESFTCVMEYPYKMANGNPVHISGDDLGMNILFPLKYYAVFKGDTIDLPANFDFQKNDSIIIFTIDSVGCYVEPVTLHYRQIWWANSIDEENATNYVRLVANTLVFNDDSEKQVYIYSTVGQLLYSKKTAAKNFDLAFLPKTSQYVCSVIVNNKKYSFHLIIR